MKNDSRPIHASAPPLAVTLAELPFEHPGKALEWLAHRGLDRLPMPGGGQTLSRWRTLAAVGAHDLGLAKLYEGHTDALAILAELGAAAPPSSIWGTWASEPPDAKVRLGRGSDGRMVLHGEKAWCSGAEHVSHALMTAWDPDGRQQLVAVDMRQPGISRHVGQWQAVGMSATESVRVRFQGAFGEPVGGPGDYIGRPGFWHGGAGVAACWLGAAQWLGDYLRARTGSGADPHRRAHLGRVHVALHGAATAMRALAACIDAAPAAPHRMHVQHVRLLVEAACDTVIAQVGQALGATPYCTDRRFARIMADLPVFLRQSHATRDLASLGEAVADQEASPWAL